MHGCGVGFLMILEGSDLVCILLLSIGAVILVVSPLLTSDLARALVALGELPTVVILDLVELCTFMAFVILVIAVVAPTTPHNVALRFEAGVR